MGADEEGDEEEDEEDAEDLEALFKPCPGRLPSLPEQGPTKVDTSPSWLGLGLGLRLGSGEP